MFFYAFQQLSPVMQLYWVLKKGTFLACRSQEQGGREAILYLYHFPDGGRGFFVELSVDEEQDCFFVMSSFSDSEALEYYAHGIRLPE